MVEYTNKDFDIKKLGSSYSLFKTTFRVFAPESERVDLILDDKTYPMDKKGFCFEKTVLGNLEGHKYYFVNDMGVSYRDPFAYYSDNQFSYILDKSKFSIVGIHLNEMKDIVLYETNVRDFSSDVSYLGKHKGKFLSFCEPNLRYDYFVIGLDYLKNIGVSHVQLMPVFEYDLDHSDYNWGYNPIAYNYVHKDYVEDQNNPYAYINELKKMVTTLHANNIRVTLDVVFNHVYRKENFDLDKMLGGHAFRMTADGKYANGTLCGNELRSEDPFIRAYILEMSKRYVELFDIDGLRMDLMGILDIETVNLINKQMKKLKEDFIVYGEGWNMGDVLPESKRATINNAKKLPGVYMFNDYFRNTIINYVCGNDQIRNDVRSCLSGENDYLSFDHSINYIECHDGMTFFDLLMKCKGSDRLDINISRAKLGLGLVMLSRGIPFVQMGQEFLRTKQLLENTYNAGDEVNKIDWYRRLEYNSVCDYFKGLVALRKENDCFNSKDAKISFDDYYGCLIYNIDDFMIIINPCVWDHIYQDGKKYKVVFDSNGTNCYTSSVLAVPACSLLVCKR